MNTLAPSPNMLKELNDLCQFTGTDQLGFDVELIVQSFLSSPYYAELDKKTRDHYAIIAMRLLRVFPRELS